MCQEHGAYAEEEREILRRAGWPRPGRMSALGHQIMRIISGPSAADVALLAGVVAVWIALAGGVQVAFAKFGKRS